MKHFRTEAGMTRQQLSEKTGLSLSGIGKIESGRSYPTEATILKICEAVNISQDDLFAYAANVVSNDIQANQDKESLIRDITCNLDALDNATLQSLLDVLLAKKATDTAAAKLSRQLQIKF
jgi:transcriptional regulator with XRE-family HTH domain